MNNQMEIADILLQIDDVDINVVDYNQRTPVYVACENRRLSMVQFLVGRGADVTMLAVLCCHQMNFLFFHVLS